MTRCRLDEMQTKRAAQPVKHSEREIRLIYID